MNHKSIYKMILEGEDIRWQSILYELVRSGKINPWDIDISTLAQEYIKILKNLERMNFNLSGKVVFAAAILLKIKTRDLGLSEFVSMTDMVDELPEEEFPLEGEEIEEQLVEIAKQKQRVQPRVEAKIPGPRTRSVTVFELVKALKRAITVEEKREKRLEIREELKRPRKHKIKKVNIQDKIMHVYARIKELSLELNQSTIEFTKLVPGNQKKDIVWTFVPLLHLSHEDKVNLHQELPFSKIFVEIKKS